MKFRLIFNRLLLVLIPAIFTVYSSSVNAQTISEEVQEKITQINNKLNLTSEQKQQIKNIFENSQMEIKNIMTTAQQEDFKEARKAGKSPQEALEATNLSEQQQTQIQEILQEQRQSIRQTLTFRQKRILRQELKGYRLNN